MMLKSKRLKARERTCPKCGKVILGASPSRLGNGGLCLKCYVTAQLQELIDLLKQEGQDIRIVNERRVRWICWEDGQWVGRSWPPRGQKAQEFYRGPSLLAALRTLVGEPEGKKKESQL